MLKFHIHNSLYINIAYLAQKKNYVNLTCKNGIFKSGFRRGIMAGTFIKDPYFTLQNSFQKCNRSIRGSVSFVILHGFCPG